MEETLKRLATHAHVPRFVAGDAALLGKAVVTGREPALVAWQRRQP